MQRWERVLAIGLTALAAGGAAGCISLNLIGGPPRPLVETVVHGESGPKILMVEIEGLISLREPQTRFIGPVRDNMVSRVREQLDKAREDPEIRALLLRIDSPGGTATASDVVYREILRFKRESDVPVIAHFLGMAASGGYYVAMAADSLVANPTSITGSIGVIFVGVSVAGLMEKLGIENQTLTAGVHKDAGSPLRRMTPEERDHIQTVLDDLQDRFREVVATGRPELDGGRIAALADGSIYSAAQARAHGLIDEIGDLEEAVALAERWAGLQSSRVVVYHRPREYENNLYTRAPIPEAAKPGLSAALGIPQSPGFYYLWTPGLQ